jgi:hypothetical protein
VALPNGVRDATRLSDLVAVAPIQEDESAVLVPHVEGRVALAIGQDFLL